MGRASRAQLGDQRGALGGIGPVAGANVQGAQLVPGSARAVDAPPSPPRYGPGGDHEQAARTARTLLAAYRDGVERGRSVRDATDPGYPR